MLASIGSMNDVGERLFSDTRFRPPHSSKADSFVSRTSAYSAHFCATSGREEQIMSAKDLKPARGSPRSEASRTLWLRVKSCKASLGNPYYIAAGIGEIDDFLKDNEAAKETIVESHPEFYFRGLLGHQFSYSKKNA